MEEKLYNYLMVTCGMHLLEVVPDHHGAVLLLVQTVHHNSAGGEENIKRFFCR